MALDVEDIEAIARRVAELLAGSSPVARHLDTATLAAVLDVGEEWVRDHAAELGAVRLGDGPRGVLRFDAVHVRAALDRRRLAGPPPPTRRSRPGPRRRFAGVELLPLPRCGEAPQ